MQTIARFLPSATGGLAIRRPAILEGDGFRMDGEHEDVMAMATDSFDVPAETLFLVFEDVTDEQIEASLEEVADLELTSAIDSPLDDQSLYEEDLAYAQLHFDEDADDMDEVVTAIRDAHNGEIGR